MQHQQQVSQVSPAQQQQPVQAQQQQEQPQQDHKPDFMNFDASQLQMPYQQQQEQQPERVGLAMIPEGDFNKLNINGLHSMNFNNFKGVNAYAVIDLPKGPDPVELLAQSPASSSRSCFIDPAAACTSGFTSSLANMDVLLAELDRAAVRVGDGLHA